MHIENGLTFDFYMRFKMSTFKEIAFQILQETSTSLHSKEITAIALERGWLKTAGKTPEATMNAQLIVDINTKKMILVLLKSPLPYLD